MKLKADISNSSGERLPGSVFLRGGSVGMLVRLFTHHQSLDDYSALRLLNQPLLFDCSNSFVIPTL